MLTRTWCEEFIVNLFRLYVTYANNSSQAVLSTPVLNRMRGYLIYTLVLHGFPTRIILTVCLTLVLMNHDLISLTQVTSVCSLSRKPRRALAKKLLR